MSDLESRLRVLPAFPLPLPVLEPATLPADPNTLFAAWLDEAIASGARQPHSMAFATVRPDGTPALRTLILKDLDADGYHFSTHRTSRKGLELDAHPRSTMLFFWRESGRQVRVTGDAIQLAEEASQHDWRERPSYTGVPNPDWQRYALRPVEFEFMQAREDRQHTRIEYRLGATGWTHEPVATPAG